MNSERVIPRLKIGQYWFPMLMLGSLPFLGVSYRSFEYDEVYRKRFSKIENIVDIISMGVEYGIDVLGIMPDIGNPLFNNLLYAIKKVEGTYGIEIGLGVCVSLPIEINGQVNTFRRWLTYYHYEIKLVDERKLLERYLNDPVLQWRKGWSKDFANAIKCMRPYVEEDFEKISINFHRVEEILKVFDGYRLVFIEPGSEVDFLAISKRLDILSILLDFLKSQFKVPVIIGSHHAGVTIPLLEKYELNFDGFMTPINMLGIMMFPSRELSLRAIKNTNKPIIAIKVLAGGRLNPSEAIRFALSYVKFLMVGVASIKELNALVRALFDALSDTRVI
ncbi:MAG: hypothetical protein ACTSXW_00095 [Candidatus Baldrarchaeia archaeon]